jgi:hypothetical protein
MSYLSIMWLSFEVLVMDHQVKHYSGPLCAMSTARSAGRALALADPRISGTARGWRIYFRKSLHF